MSLGGICQHDVDLAQSDENVQSVAERMRQRTVGCLVIVEKSQTPIGIVTDRDLVVRVLADGLDPTTTPIVKVMTKCPSVGSEDMPIETALGLMRAGHFRRLPVVDRGGRVSGLVTLDDILMLLAEEFVQIGDVLDSETPRAAAVAVR